MLNTLQHTLRSFQFDVSQIEKPKEFTFPFYYEPHHLVHIAAQELQNELKTRNFNHNFGLDSNSEGLVIGKMFGVLVVEKVDQTLGYLAAFSGKLGDQNHHDGFVPPVFDMLKHDGYFKQEEEIINQINLKIEATENASVYKESLLALSKTRANAEKDIARLKKEIKEGKRKRKSLRDQAYAELSGEALTDYLDALSKESIKEQFNLKDAHRYWRHIIANEEAKVISFQNEIRSLKNERKKRSSALQNRLFSDYNFLNGNGKQASLLTIFGSKEETTPPAGAGECAAPKLLHYAFKHQLKPIAMGEFWWGASPKSEVRTHQQFYPACRGKCEPILGHMLKGLSVERNPMLDNLAAGKSLEVVYEDEFLLVVNKPIEFLSVPGKNLYDSVLTRMESLYPEATGPLLVHRLDMSTSGLLLVAKKKEIHKKLQEQFLNRTITKCYEALLDGVIETESGVIELPLRVDFFNRPQQLVCYEHGKPAKTKWEKVKVQNGKTLVHFYPITGRTHQLRVHAAHKDGLQTPILGDDLYGTKADRLYLHAAYLKFKHPVTKEEMEFYVKAEFVD